MRTIGGQTFPEEQIRERVSYQKVELTTGTAADMVTAITGYYQDLLMVTGHNNSDAAVTIELYDGGTSTKLKITIPAATAKTWTFPTPLKQATSGLAWTADMGDYTNTTIALYVQSVRKPK